MAKSYEKKIIISGDIIEFYEYEIPVLEDFQNSKSKGKGRSCEADEGEKINNRVLVLSRARRDLRRIINSNIHRHGFPSKFVTLTFEEHITTFEKANYEWKKFKQRLEYDLGFSLHYAVVPEFTKKGRIHFHAVLFNVPYIKNSRLREIWGNGFVKINKIDNCDNVGAYVCKYMTADNVDVRLVGKKSYFTSRNLYKPIELKEKSKVESFADFLPADSLVYEDNFINDYNNTIYRQYNMSAEKVKVKNKVV